MQATARTTTICCCLLLAQLLLLPACSEAIALSPRSSADDGDGNWSFQMQQQQEQPQPMASNDAAVASSSSIRWKRGAEIALLLAHICRQYKAKGVPPPARYKCP